MENARRVLIDELAREEAILDGRSYRQKVITRFGGEPDPLTSKLIASSNERIADLTEALSVLDPTPPEPTDYKKYRFRRGDHIEVIAKLKEDYFGTVRGTALDDREFLGYAVFDVLLDDGTVRSFNLNNVLTLVLFSADTARGV